MKFNLNLSIDEARLVCIFINRAIWEQFERNMKEAYLSDEENRNRIYDTIGAFNNIEEELKKQIIEKKENKK